MNIPNIRYTISFILAATVFLESLAYGQNGGNPEINFAVTREGEFIQTEARVDLPVSPAVAWAVLTALVDDVRATVDSAELTVVLRTSRNAASPVDA